MKFNTLLILIDRYPFRCEAKGGYRKMVAQTMINTTNRSSREMYNLPDEDIKQLERRLDLCGPVDQVFQSQAFGNTIQTPVIF
jgi:hypothetical protein